MKFILDLRKGGLFRCLVMLWFLAGAGHGCVKSPTYAKQQKKPLCNGKGTKETGNSVTPQHTLNNSSVDSFFRKGQILAASHHSELCRRNRLASNFSSWQRSTGVWPSWGKQETSTIGRGPPFLNSAFGTSTHRAIYIRNQKVASTMFMREGGMFAGAPGVMGGSLFRQNERLPPGGHITCRSGDFYFSFVRDPIRYFIAGFLEIMCRTGAVETDAKRKGAAKALGLMISEQGKATSAGSKILKAFIRDLESKRFVGRSGIHVWPQALKLDAVPAGCKFQFIGKVEDMSGYMRALFPKGTLPAHDHKAQDKLCKAKLSRNLRYGASEVRALCALLRADYLCYDYPMPAVCKP